MTRVAACGEEAWASLGTYVQSLEIIRHCKAFGNAAPKNCGAALRARHLAGLSVVAAGAAVAFGVAGLAFFVDLCAAFLVVVAVAGFAGSFTTGLAASALTGAATFDASAALGVSTAAFAGSAALHRLGRLGGGGRGRRLGVRGGRERESAQGGQELVHMGVVLRVWGMRQRLFRVAAFNAKVGGAVDRDGQDPSSRAMSRWSHSRSRATVTGRRVASEWRSIAVSVVTSVAMSRRPCASR